MLLPRRTKFRKVHRGRRRGYSKGQTTVQFGDYGLKALDAGWITNRQIEAARIAMTRKIKRGGKVWINVFPDKSFTKKPAETRMGSGKGSPEGWVAVIKPGGSCSSCRGSRSRLRAKRCDWQVRSSPSRRRSSRGRVVHMKAKDLRELSDEELERKLTEARQELFNLRFQFVTGALENPARMALVKRDIARSSRSALSARWRRRGSR